MNQQPPLGERRDRLLFETIGCAVLIVVDPIVLTRAQVVAVFHSITVAVIVRDAAAANTRLNLVGIVWATVHAVFHPVTVGIIVGSTAAADTWLSLAGVVRAAVDTVFHAVTVGIVVGHTAPANAWISLSWIIRTSISALTVDTVTVRIALAGGIITQIRSTKNATFAWLQHAARTSRHTACFGGWPWRDFDRQISDCTDAYPIGRPERVAGFALLDDTRHHLACGQRVGAFDSRSRERSGHQNFR